MIFPRLFRRRRRDYDYDEEYEQGGYYADLEEGEGEIEEELNLSDEEQAKHYAIDLCDQMIKAAKDIEDTRAEYDLVTSYLTDVQIIEDLTEDERKPIADCAAHVDRLGKERSEFLKTERRLSDGQFAQMQEEEDALPGIIKRLKSNEAYLDTVKRDMAFLEGKKLEWKLVKNDAVRTQRLMQKSACYLFLCYFTLMAFAVIVSWYMEMDLDLRLVMTILSLIAVLLGGYILIRYMDASTDLRKSNVNRNRAISLENHVKIKYVNIKNAVDYTCEKYHVRNSYELSYIYEQYQAEAKEKEKFRETSDELNYYTNTLLQYLNRLRMYDAKAWLNHANAIVDSRELVEMKHQLITRRQKLRTRMEYSKRTIANMKQEALVNIRRMGEVNPQLVQIIRQIDKMNLGRQ
ncbi:MAG: hypothetical protein MR508_04165 [Lachnospiraceae bacterium]|nr:hypothetical protein [Lachnospiraceae bacterium]